ncbi:hypothetical protein [Flavobacterium sp. 102]|uniref:hypothetical protein n=1 Tax=Flavobacterium sp. 102 TaxID=2135623 RepID=UPI000EB10DA7|nr:hypothetical protein [Flavobacterium sp. 102]RKS00669.1 hypothetical protein C8C84_0292 [Flavobacterium sp. 102]
MEPNNIEKQFRDKLNAREIQPSAQAWDRLDAMLSVAEEKKTRKPFGFLFIAASILVFVTLGLFLFNQNGTEVNPQNTIVGTETKIDTVQKGIEKNQNPIIEKSQEQQVVINKFQSSPETEPNSLERSGKNQKTNTNQNQIIKDKPIEFQNSSDVAQKDLPRIAEQKEIIVKKPIVLKSDESLLADLDKSAKQSTNQKSSLKVDAKSLLSQVDGEVEYTFREKMLQKINKNYQEVKVALANRNNE